MSSQLLLDLLEIYNDRGGDMSNRELLDMKLIEKLPNIEYYKVTKLGEKLCDFLVYQTKFFMVMMETK